MKIQAIALLGVFLAVLIFSINRSASADHQKTAKAAILTTKTLQLK